MCTVVVSGPRWHATGTATVHQRGHSTVGVIVVLPRAALRRMAHTLSSTRVRVSVSATGYGSSRILRASRARGLVAASVHLVPRGGIFGPGSATPNAAGRRFLRLVARQLRHAHRVTCIGFTAAATGDDLSYRRDLSLRRARAACTYLRRHGVRARFVARAAGSTNPVASNASARGRARNRRVELKILR